MRRTRPALAGAVAGSLLASVSGASVVGTTGGIQVVSSPADARPNAFTSAHTIRVWNEQQGIVLGGPLVVDAAAPGLYDSASDLAEIVIGAGTPVNSHYLHFDSPERRRASASGSVTFDAPIIGVIARGDHANNLGGHLDRSDFLGAEGTVYPDRVVNRGLEFNTDRFSISEDRRTLTVHNFTITSPGDFVRIITDVPAPATLSAVAAGILAARRRRASR